MSEYFFISNDLDGNVYLVPHNQRAVWFGMRDQGFPDEMPYWAKEIGDTENVIFLAPRILDRETDV